MLHQQPNIPCLVKLQQQHPSVLPFLLNQQKFLPGQCPLHAGLSSCSCRDGAQSLQNTNRSEQSSSVATLFAATDSGMKRFGRGRCNTVTAPQWPAQAAGGASVPALSSITLFRWDSHHLVAPEGHFTFQRLLLGSLSRFWLHSSRFSSQQLVQCPGLGWGQPQADGLVGAEPGTLQAPYCPASEQAGGRTSQGQPAQADQSDTANHSMSSPLHTLQAAGQGLGDRHWWMGQWVVSSCTVQSLGYVLLSLLLSLPITMSMTTTLTHTLTIITLAHCP